MPKFHSANKIESHLWSSKRHRKNRQTTFSQLLDTRIYVKMLLPIGVYGLPDKTLQSYSNVERSMFSNNQFLVQCNGMWYGVGNLKQKTTYS